MITQDKSGFHVLSEKGKNLGGPYKTREEAAKRLRQVEYFKHHKTASLKELGFSKTALSPELLQRASNAASQASEQHTIAFQTLKNMSEKPGASSKLLEAAKQSMGLARKKNSQSIKFLTEAVKIR